MGGGAAKERQEYPQSITANSIKGLVQVYEICISTYVMYSAFLLYLPQHEDHVYSPSAGPEPTLAFWRVLFIFYYRLDELIQQGTGQDFACNGDQSDASIV